MQIIPVIDLKNGHVVRAVQGKRNHYVPINSPLCQNSDVFSVIEKFLRLYPFDTFYIADLNAITNQQSHDQLILELLNSYSEKTFWIDAGIPSINASYVNCINYFPVIGSESLKVDDFLKTSKQKNEFVLSLDFSGQTQIGDCRIFENTEFWPDMILIMNLLRIGSDCGPDYLKLSGYSKQFPDKEFVAAGGVRNLDDLKSLSEIGIDRVLIASALHSGALSSAEIYKAMKT